MITAPLVLLGGLLYRQRGGGIDLPIGTQGARAVWCIPTGILVAALTGNWWLAPAVAAMAFLGLMIPHGAFQDDGTYAGDWLTDAIGMSGVCAGRGALMTVPISALYWGWGTVDVLPMILLPALAGLAYHIAWKIPSTIPHLERGCALGEFMTGCLIWGGILLAVA